MKQISNYTFMTVAFYIFLIIGVMNLASLIYTYKVMNIFSIISSSASVFFNFLIAYMFLVWRESAPRETDSKDIEELIKDIKEEIK